MTAAPPTPRPLSRTAAVLLFLLVCGGGLFLDLFSKWLAFENISTRLLSGIRVEEGHPVAIDAEKYQRIVIPKLLHFHATVNEGAVFGLGQGQQKMFVLVSVAAIGFLLYLVTRTRSRFEVVLLGCLLAGVLGNMYDRIRYTYVRDMILALPGVSWPGTWQLPLLNYPGAGERLVFPYIFNIADCLLVCGVGVLLIRSLFAGDKDRPRMNADERGSMSKDEPITSS